MSDLRTQLAAQILGYIIDNGLEKGHHVVEDSLTTFLGVSRSPVRGALNLLQEKGVLERKPNRGFFLKIPASEIDLSQIPLPVAEEERLYASIIDDRVKGRLDDVQTEAELMRRYGMRRSVINRVLARLTKEQIIERNLGVGWVFLPAIDSQEAHYESYRIRILVEPAGPLEPTWRLDQRKAQQLIDRHRALVKRRCKDTTSAEMFDLNAEFHAALASFSGNRFFLDVVRQQNRLRRLLEYESVHNRERMVQSCKEHLSILEALKDGERAWASSLLKRHLEVAADLATGDYGRSLRNGSEGT